MSETKVVIVWRNVRGKICEMADQRGFLQKIVGAGEDETHPRLWLRTISGCGTPDWHPTVRDFRLINLAGCRDQVVFDAVVEQDETGRSLGEMRAANFRPYTPAT